MDASMSVCFLKLELTSHVQSAGRKSADCNWCHSSAGVQIEISPTQFILWQVDFYHDGNQAKFMQNNLNTSKPDIIINLLLYLYYESKML